MFHFEKIFLIGNNESLIQEDDAQDRQFYNSLKSNANRYLKAPKILNSFQAVQTCKAQNEKITRARVKVQNQ